MSGSIETPAKTAAAQAQAAAAPAIKADTLVPVLDPATGQTIQVPYGKVMERYSSASVLETKIADTNSRAQQNDRLISFASDVRDRLKKDPKGALAELTSLAEQLSGTKLTSDDEAIDLATADPATKALLRRLDRQDRELAELRTGRNSDQAMAQVNRTLDSIETFKTSKAARQLGQLVTLALREKDPSMHVDDAAVFVNNLLEQAHQERLQLTRDARAEAEGTGDPTGGAGDPALSQVEPLTAKDVKSGKFRDSVGKVANAWLNKLKP